MPTGGCEKSIAASRKSPQKARRIVAGTCPQAWRLQRGRIFLRGFSWHLWQKESLRKAFWKPIIELPSGNLTKKSIEHDHWNSEFSHSKNGGSFQFVMSTFTRGSDKNDEKNDDKTHETLGSPQASGAPAPPGAPGAGPVGCGGGRLSAESRKQLPVPGRGERGSGRRPWHAMAARDPASCGGDKVMLPIPKLWFMNIITLLGILGCNVN